MSLALVTSVYGAYDTLSDPLPQEGVDDYVAVVDELQPGCNLWRQIVEPRPQLHPRLAAKVAKCCPFEFTWCDHAVWIDGSARLKHHGVAQWAASNLTETHQIAQFAHPERSDYFAEMEVSRGMRKYAETTVHQQAEHYFGRGLRNYGLWATGIIAKRMETGRWVGFGRDWLAEQLRWSYQDQVSEPFVLWSRGLKPAELPGSLWNNEHVVFGGHVSEA